MEKTKTYNLCLRTGTEFYITTDDRPFETYKTIWTSVKVRDDITDVHYIRHLVKNHIAQQMAKKLFGDITIWKQIKMGLIMTDIEVWCEGTRIA